MSGEPSGYLSYLVRLWQDNDDDMPCPEDRALHPRKGKTAWRASVESARTGRRRSFASLDDLCAFLMEQTRLVSGGDTDEEQKRRGVR
jgi:hypothetical protein